MVFGRIYLIELLDSQSSVSSYAGQQNDMNNFEYLRNLSEHRPVKLQTPGKLNNNETSHVHVASCDLNGFIHLCSDGSQNLPALAAFRRGVSC